MRNLEGGIAVEDGFVEAFISSAAFSERFNDLLRAFERMTALQQTTITACERAVETASADLSDIRTARSVIG